MPRAFMLVLGGLAALQSSSAMPLRPPANFRQLPAAFQEQLVAEGCGIPESGFSSRTNSNVIQGAFATSGQLDWAVLCTKDGRTAIRVFSSGAAASGGAAASAACPVRLEERGNSSDMVLDGRDGPYYGRSLYAASPARIREAHGSSGAAAGVTLPPEVTHDGIEDATEKGSAILYCHNGAWLRLAGAD
jgi:hypothetical protein